MPPQLSNPFRRVLEEGKPAVNPFREIQKNGKGSPRSGVSANFVAREFASRRALNNILAVPDSSGELLANAANAGRAGFGQAVDFGINNLRSLVGMDRQPGPTFGERYADKTESEGIFQKVFRSIPRPTAEKTAAAVSSIPALVPFGESPSEAYNRELSEDEAFQASMREAHPTAATVGDIGGDVLSLFLARKGSSSGNLIRGIETRLGGRAAAGAVEGLAGDLDKIVRGPAMQRLARGGVRSLEAGVEAAALDILKDPNADPSETAALAAGGQLVGSGLLGATQGVLTGGGWKGALGSLSVAALTTAGLLQMVKSSTPGGRDRILESIEGGFDKVVLTMGLGAASAAISATRYGRGNTALSDQTRAFLDGVATTHRGAVMSVLTDWTDGDDAEKARIENVLSQIAKDPNYKGESLEEQRIVMNLREGPKYKTGGSF